MRIRLWLRLVTLLAIAVGYSTLPADARSPACWDCSTCSGEHCCAGSDQGANDCTELSEGCMESGGPCPL
jgi:hypothetical protein